MYKKFDIDAMMAMVVGNPAAVHDIIASFRSDPKYIGGGSGSGFKELVINELDDTTPLAKAIGAVNVIKRESDGRLIGDNTDGAGYVESLAQTMSNQGQELKGSRILILGAGGTGRAIAFALADRGAGLVILNRTKSKAVELSQSVNAHFGKIAAIGGDRELISEYLPSSDAVVSVIDDATSPLDEYSTLGTMELPVTTESLQQNRDSSAKLLSTARPSLIVSDIRLRTNETPMLKQAREMGFAILDGVPMVINQGVAAFWWLYGDHLTKQGVTKEDIAKIMLEVI
jgi:shikimate dehydrogenase